MDQPVTSNSYSADVRLQLQIGDRAWKLAQVAGDFIILSSPADLPPGPAEVLMQIDGREHRWQVELPEGASASSPRVRTERRRLVSTHA